MEESKRDRMKVRMEKWSMLQKCWQRTFKSWSQGARHNKEVRKTIAETIPFNIKHLPNRMLHGKWRSASQIHFKMTVSKSTFQTMTCLFEKVQTQSIENEGVIQ